MSNYLMAGLDIGFRHTGAVVAVPTPGGKIYEPIAWDCFHTEPSSKKKGILVANDDVRCVQEMIKKVDLFLAPYKQFLKALVVELPHAGSQSNRASRSMGIATGMVAAYAQIMNLPTVWITPGDLKKHVGGSRSAAKEKVEQVIRDMYPDFAWPIARKHKKKNIEHVFDGMGALLAGSESDIYKLIANDNIPS